MFWRCIPNIELIVIGGSNFIGILVANENLSPLRLRFEIDGLHLAKEGGKNLLDFKKLVITLKWTKLVLGELGFDEIILDEPQLLLEKKITKTRIGSPSGIWNWHEFIHAVEKTLPAKDPKEDKKPIKISVDELIVSGATLRDFYLGRGISLV